MNTPRKILLLGASGPQIPSILEAKRQGYYVITCDNRPDNPGHALADESYEVSTIDKEAVLALAQRCQVDGVLCYMSDVSAPTAAYVCEKMGFPTSPYESVKILTDKGRFREFLREHGFNCPQSRDFTQEEASAAEAYAITLGFPVVIKPVDSSGSKGVRIVETQAALSDALQEAYEYSISKRIIVETFVDCVGDPICGEAFSVEGELRFCILDDQHFGASEPFDLTPIWHGWPCHYAKETQEKIRSEVQRAIRLLRMRSNAYNLEIRLDAKGDVWLMEIAPRNGGNMLPQVIQHATGVDLVTYMVKAAMGISCEDLRQAEVNGFWAVRCLYSERDMTFMGIRYEEALRAHLAAQHVFVKPGDAIHAIRNAGHTFGVAIFHFDTREEMESLMATAADQITLL